MRTMKRLAAGAATTAMALALLTAAAHAQETTSGIDGSAHSAGGAPIAGAPVTVVFEPTNQTFSATTDKDGRFSVRTLPPGGPYRVSVAGLSSEIPSIGIGSAYQIDLAPKTAAGTAVSEVVVVASRRTPQVLQTGPRSSFSAVDVETLPSFSRDLKDIARLNPFVTLDPTNSNALIIGGNNPRYNAIYIDGVRESDDFGLNSNGYPTQRSPLSVDLVDSFNVEIAPYDVQYGSFQGGVLNIATKSGGNDFHGSAFFEYDSDHFGAGKVIRDLPAIQKFQDKNYGVVIGGPIVPDRLFFEFGYEKYEGIASASFGPSDTPGATNLVTGVTGAQVAQIQSILNTVYNYNPGNFGISQPIQDEKYFGKLTWNITSKQRFVFEAQSDVGTVFNQPDSSGTRLGLSSSTYLFSQPLLAFTGFLYSNWTPNFSTEISYTHRQTDGDSIALGGNTFANFNVFLNNNNTALPTVNLGPDISRQVNALLTTDQNLRFKAKYSIGNHTITAGYERDQLDVYNAFVQNATGAYTFTSITNLQNRQAFSLNYANAADNVGADGAARWGDVDDAFYLQDEWRPFQALTLRAGVRAELYEQDAKPQYNPTFQKNYGFSNQSTLDGRYTILPRIGFNYKADPTFIIYGGVGEFSGGNPNVWLSNNYSNTGNLLGAVTCTLAPSSPCGAAALQNVNGFAIPANVQALNTASANKGLGITNELDPNFDLLTVAKASTGFTKVFNFSEYNWTGFVGRLLGDQWNLHGDYVYQKTIKGIQWKDLALNGQQSGTAPDGRPIFNPTRFTAGPNQPTNLIGRNNEYDLLLTNTDRGGGFYWDIGLGKTWRSGWSFDFTYTHTRLTEISPATSSVALSNYRLSAFTNPNNPALAISSYNVKDQFKVRASYNHEFFNGLATHINLYGQRRSGLPFSYTFTTANNGLVDNTFGLTAAVASNQELIYVPKTDASGNVTLTSDPKVSYAPSTAGLTQAAFVGQVDAFLKSTGLIKYAGQITPRNTFTSRDVTTVDLELVQEFPAFIPHGAKGELYFDIFNLGNLINNGWGVLDQYGFPGAINVITTGLIPCTAATACAPGQANQYQFSALTPRTPVINTNGNPPPSSWALKVGVRYKF